MFELSNDFDIEEDWEKPYRQCMEAGIRVMPLYPIVDGKCGCGDPDCVTTGKHPINSGWQNTPVWDDEQVASMRIYLGQLYPAYGVIVRDGLLIVDVDERNGGVESFERLQKDLGVSLRGKFSVQSGSGGGSSHDYFRSTKDIGKLKQSLKDYPGIDFKSSGYVVGWGSPHKSGLYYERMIGFPEDIGEPPAELLELLKRPERVASGSGEFADVTSSDIKEMLTYIENNEGTDYEVYLAVGMAVHYALGGSLDGLSLWHEWAEKSSKYIATDLDRRWHSFGKKVADPVTMGTIYKWAEDGGYKPTVTFNTDEFAESAATVKHAIEVRAKNIKPWDMPGASGKLYQWLDGQCRYPRPTIAAGAVLYALSCIAGMRHIDERDGMTLNMIIFSVAGTGTGKEAIGQAVTSLLDRVGIVSAMHGKIKSEQEMYRNLLDHRASFYSIDELGYMLKKISSDKAADYMVAVIGAIMEIYSAAEGILPVTGDLKKEVQEKLSRQIAQVTKRIDDGKGNDIDEKNIQSLTKALEDSDKGIKNPYMSIFGTTTPTTFDSVITPDSAQNGFIARALILREHEDNPRWRPNFKKAQMDIGLELALKSLYYGGSSASDTGRVECVGAPVNIRTNQEAADLLDEAYEYFWELGEYHKDKTGLTGITRRGWEMTSKISLVLAAADGAERTAAHVLYGFAMAKNDNDLKIEYAYSSDAKADNSVIPKLLSRLDAATGTTLGQVNRILRGVSVEGGTEALLSSLEAKNMIRMEEVRPERGGRATKMIYRV